jgi:hypothetical protein
MTCDDLTRDGHHDVDGYRIAGVGTGLFAEVPPVRGGGVHADHLRLRVDERPTGIAGLDDRVDLDRAGEGLAVPGVVARGDLLVEGGHIAFGHRRCATLTPGVSEGHDAITDRDFRGVADIDRREAVNAGDLQDCDVIGNGIADHGGDVAGAGSADVHADVRPVGDDVIVRDDLARRADDHPGPSRFGTAPDVRVDRDDRRSDPSRNGTLGRCYGRG